MDGSFACPDCGCPIRLSGSAPGRQVLCGFCSALVEVPYFPRVTPKRRSRRSWSSRRWARGWSALPLWGRLATATLCLAILVAATHRTVRSHHDASEARVLARMVDSVRASEELGNTGDALAELEAALVIARGMRRPADGLDELRRWRTRLSVRDVQARLAAIESAENQIDPATGVGEALTLLARAEKDHALTGLVPQIDRTLARHRRRLVSAKAAEARRLIDQGSDARALELCREMREHAQGLANNDRERVEAAAQAMAGELILRSGIVVEPVRGNFTLGSPESYQRTLIEPLTESLRDRGYLPQPPRTPWGGLWESLAPFRATFVVRETQDATYLGSPNRVSRIDGFLDIRRGDALVWSDRSQGKTRTPLPKAPAYIASRLAVSNHRSPEFERLLYDDARESLADRLRNTFRNIPERPATRPLGTTAERG